MKSRSFSCMEFSFRSFPPVLLWAGVLTSLDLFSSSVDLRVGNWIPVGNGHVDTHRGARGDAEAGELIFLLTSGVLSPLGGQGTTWADTVPHLRLVSHGVLEAVPLRCWWREDGSFPNEPRAPILPVEPTGWLPLGDCFWCGFCFPKKLLDLLPVHFGLPKRSFWATVGLGTSPPSCLVGFSVCFLTPSLRFKPNNGFFSS